MKHRPVTDAVPDSWVRGIQDRLHFLGSEISDKPGVRLFRRDGQNPLDLLQRRRHAIFHVVHERFDSCEADVSGTSAIAATCFQVVQEVHNERSVQLFQLQLRGRQLDAGAGVFEQKPEGMRIGVASVGAGAPLDGQALLEEGGDVWGEKDHGRPPVKKLWHESAMFLIRSGVASRYQYVSATLLWPRYVDNANICFVIRSRPSGQVSSALTANVWRREWIVGRGSRLHEGGRPSRRCRGMRFRRHAAVTGAFARKRTRDHPMA